MNGWFAMRLCMDGTSYRVRILLTAARHRTHQGAAVELEEEAVLHNLVMRPVDHDALSPVLLVLHAELLHFFRQRRLANVLRHAQGAAGVDVVLVVQRPVHRLPLRGVKKKGGEEGKGTVSFVLSRRFPSTCGVPARWRS